MAINKKLFVLIILLLTTSIFSQVQIRFASYNVKQYPANNNKSTELKRIMNAIKPTILLTVELDGKDAVKQLLANVLDSTYKASTEVSITWGTGNECAVFYVDSILTYLGSSMIAADTRPIAEFKFVTKATQDTFIVFGAHLKAYPEETTRRLNAVNSLRNRTLKLKPSYNYLIAGDFNIFTYYEPAFLRLLDQNTDGYFIDMLNAVGSWNANPAFASVCSYSATSLKTRLDMILVSPALINNTGMEYISNSFKIFGNDDGNHYGTSITNSAKGTNYWLAQDASLGASLINFSDHLPIYADFSFEKKTDVSNNLQLPESFELFQNYPNPFNPSTTIHYTIKSTSHVSLKIYDVLGNEVAVLVNEVKQPGTYNIDFRQPPNGEFTSGIYFYRLQTGNFSQTKKMVLVK